MSGAVSRSGAGEGDDVTARIRVSAGELVTNRRAADMAYPGRLERLILLDPSAPGRRYGEMTVARQAAARTPADSAALAQPIASEAFRNREPAAISEMFRIVFRSTFVDTTLADRLVIDLNEQTARNGALIPYVLFASLGVFGDRDRLSAIRAPTLVLHGAQDPIPTEMVRDMCERIPDCTFALIDRTAHFPWIEQPDSTFAASRRFMADAAAPGR